MKKIALSLAGVLVVALTVLVAKRLSSEAMAVIVGIVCGIGASIPTSLVMLFLLSRQESTDDRHHQQELPNVTVMIVSPPAGTFQRPEAASDGRQFYIHSNRDNVTQSGGQYLLGPRMTGTYSAGGRRYVQTEDGMWMELLP